MPRTWVHWQRAEEPPRTSRAGCNNPEWETFTSHQGCTAGENEQRAAQNLEPAQSWKLPSARRNQALNTHTNLLFKIKWLQQVVWNKVWWLFCHIPVHPWSCPRSLITEWNSLDFSLFLEAAVNHFSSLFPCISINAWGVYGTVVGTMRWPKSRCVSHRLAVPGIGLIT